MRPPGEDTRTRRQTLLSPRERPPATRVSDAAPSARARELVRGGYDMHVHIAPDVVERKISDVALAQRCAELGLAASSSSRTTPLPPSGSRGQRGSGGAVRVLGAITLNRAVGGLNALAVEIAAREGARTVWFPTVNSVNEQHEVHPAPPGAKLPVWVKFELELREAGHDVSRSPCRRRRRASGGGAAVLAVIARHDMVLATGHLSRDEIFTLVDAAFDAGVRTVVVTHPEFPSQSISIADQLALAERGALLERCFTTPHTGKVSWDRDL